MAQFRLRLSKRQREVLMNKLDAARRDGIVKVVNRILAVLAFADGRSLQAIAATLKVNRETVRGWIKRYLWQGLRGLYSGKSPGRPPKLTKSQRRQLAKWIEDGPAEAGFAGNCWRSPMIQHLIETKFGVLYAVKYISELLKNMGFSYQKARFVSDHLDKEARKQWLDEKWPEILAQAQRLNAHILFGDEASFPQWGSLTYTWARKGRQPTIETSGKRKGYKVFGLIDYFSGRFFYKCQEERLNSKTYEDFLREVLAKTRKPIILIQDKAPYHTSAAMNKFFAQHQDRLIVHDLPSYSPDYNPIEKLWKEIKKEGIHLHYFPTFESLKGKVHEALMIFKDTSKKVLRLFGMYNDLEAPQAA